MRRYLGGSLLVVAAAVSVALAADSGPGQLDPRFDGKWVGIETFIHHNGFESFSGAPQMKAIIMIADSGTTVGIVEGFAPGRYLISPKSKGNTILFDAPMRRAKLTLSADGNTMKEDGNAAVYVRGRGKVLTQLTATFHRMGK